MMNKIITVPDNNPLTPSVIFDALINDKTIKKEINFAKNGISLINDKYFSLAKFITIKSIMKKIINIIIICNSNFNFEFILINLKSSKNPIKINEKNKRKIKLYLEEKKSNFVITK